MHRFYIGQCDCSAGSLCLSGREAHHALHVLRLHRGERAQVLNGEGCVLDCEVADANRRELQLLVLERNKVPRPPHQVTLAQAIPKGKLFDSIIQKATELGVWRIVPLLTERTVSKIESGEKEQKLEKWNQVAIESIKQCGSPWLPKIEMPCTIKEFLEIQSKIDLRMVGSLENERRHPRKCFEEFARKNGKLPHSISVAIGPEGDFTPEELQVFKLAGAQPITLGNLVLRTETAAMYCLSIINYETQSA